MAGNWFACICVVVATAHVVAQTPTATLEGIVRDGTGAAVPRPEVVVVAVDTRQTHTVVGDAAGSFRLTGLPVGVYELGVDHAGFAPFRHSGIALAIGQTARIAIDLQPAAVVERVTVSDQPLPLDVRQTAMTTAIDTERIEELPVRSRNYLEFVLLAPGVVSVVATLSASAAGVLPSTGFSVGGLRPRSNTLSIDGIDNSDEFTGGSRTDLSLEMVREFQVVNNGWSAESGSASGGSINVVTKSGTNTIHGDTFLFGQSGVFNAQPKLEETGGARPSLTRLRGGAAIGGPLASDRSFFFAAAERERSRGEAASDIQASTVQAINNLLQSPLLHGLSTEPLTSGLFPVASTETELSAKLTHQLSTTSTLVLRAAGSDNRDDNDAFDTGGLMDRSARGSRATRDVALAGAWSAVLSSNVTSEFRVQLATRRIGLHTAEPQAVGVAISGVAEFGAPYAGNSTHREAYGDIGEVLGLSAGSHFVKTGIAVRRVGLTGTTDDGRRGLFVFPSFDAFQRATPDSYRQTFGASDVDVTARRIGLFVQDHWMPRRTLTIDLGIRYDGTDVTPLLTSVSRQTSPRAAVAWTPSSGWVIRAGAGTFADRLVLASLEPAWLTQNRHRVEQIAGPARAQALLAAADAVPFAAPVRDLLPSIATIGPVAWHPRSRQLSAGVERQLASNLTASITLSDIRGLDLPRTVNVNLAPVDPTHDAIFDLQPTAASTYRALTATLNRRLANELEWTVAYTWSHARDSASEFDEQPQNPSALNDEWSDSRYDQRHRLVASAIFDLPIGDDEDSSSPGQLRRWERALSHISIAPILTVGSGHPENAVTGADHLRTGAWPLTARPPGSPRNSLRLPWTATLDLRALKYFPIGPHGKLDLVVETFNLLNRTNVTQLNPVYGPLPAPIGTFGRPIDAATARHIQFAIDFEF